MYDILLSIFLGFISGFFTGFTGISALGIVLAGLSITQIIPDYKTVIGTVLYLLMFPFTIGSVWQFYKIGKINFFLGNILLISVLIGSYLGSKLVLTGNLKISNKTIKYTTGWVAFIMAIYFLSSAYHTMD
jgi:uncharacterized membrane protein YfcA